MMMTNKQFYQSKQQLLQNLYQNGIDFSPKGSIDIPIRELVWLINLHSSYYTTSSCSGRVSISVPTDNLGNKGVTWLFVKHGYILKDELASTIDQLLPDQQSLVTLKCEPFIMHVCCKNIQEGQKLLHLALESGYRESGLVLSTKGHVMLAIRTTSFHLEFPIAIHRSFLIKEEYLDLIVADINRRMKENFTRIHLFFTKLKSHWQWPLFSLQSEKDLSIMECLALGIPQHHWKRWGHSIFEVKNRWVLCGGQGIENKQNLVGLKQFHSSRSTSSLAFPPLTKDGWKDSEPIIIDNFPLQVHGQLLSFQYEGQTWGILSGGRLSPMHCLPCLQLFQIETPATDKDKLQYIPWKEYIEEGEVPEPRWGHSFLAIGGNTFLLLGGRNQQQIFDNCYLLKITITTNRDSNNPISTFLHCHWSRLHLTEQHPEEGSLSIGLQHRFHPRLQRFFHAACVLPVDLELVNIISSSSSFPPSSRFGESMIVLIHGGLASLSNPQPLSDAFFIDLQELLIQGIELTPPDSHYLSRFGHTLTNIDGKCLFLIGGYEDCSKTNHCQTVPNASYLLDYSVILKEAELSLTAKNPLRKDLLISIRPFSYYYDNTDSSCRRVQTSSSFPCQRCRGHHQVYLPSTLDSFSSQPIYIVGGGAMTLAFGNHYCTSLKLRMIRKDFNEMIANPQLLVSSEELSRPLKVGSQQFQRSKGDDNNKKPITKKEEEETAKEVLHSNPIKGSYEYAIIVPIKEVKTLKVWLENHQIYDKSRKIQPLEKMMSMSAVGMGKTYEINLLQSLEVSTHSAVPNQRMEEIFSVSSQVGETEGKEKSETIMAPLSLMMVPIVASGFPSFVEKQNRLLFQSLLQWYRYPALVFIEITCPAETSSSSSFLSSSAPVTRYGEKGANQYLQSLIRDHPRYTDLVTEIPTKYEFVGDVCLIPEIALISPEWIELSNDTLWETLLSQYFPKVTRIARRRIIEKSLMRQSQIHLLYVHPSFRQQLTQRQVRKLCVCGKSHYPLEGQQDEEGKGKMTLEDHDAFGWTTIIENKIKFSFDLTKVMFCSGNVTERMRMEKLTFTRPEVIFDLYAGIGYYTVPVLKYHGNKIQAYYACEWNPNSIQALYHNLIQNEILPPAISPRRNDDPHQKISPSSASASTIIYDFSVQNEHTISPTDLQSLHLPLLLSTTSTPLSTRVKILQGNNAFSTLSFEDVADRVLLGLLPSSENGWEIAVRLLNRRTGGIFHLHENVLAKDLQVFIQERLLKKLTVLCQKWGKGNMEINIIHIERVKSYAPHVFHYVFDILFRPK